jgi:CelD/BcsL family acetyltransferase involved in cellulose biosynthesis
LLSVERISRVEGLKDIETQWDEVLQASKSNTLFLSYGWIYNWWKSFSKDKELLILVVKESDEIIGIAPLMIEKYKVGRLTFKQISFIHNAHCYHLDFIITRRTHDVIELILKYLKNEVKNWKRIYLNRIPVSSNNIKAIRNSCWKSYLLKDQYGGIAPYITVNETWEDYYTKRKRKFRGQERDWKKLFNKEGLAEFKIYNNDPSIDSVIKTVFEIDKTTWKEKEGSAVCSTPELRQFYSEIIRIASENRQLVLVILYLNVKPAGFLLCINYYGTLYELKMGFDPKISKYSLGYLIENHLLEHIFNESKVEKCDLLGGEFTHWKKRYTDVGREFVTIFMYRKTLINYVHFILRNQIKKSNFLNRLKNCLR